MQVHVARVGIFNVDSLGNRIDKSNPNTSINQLKATRQEALVIADSNSNTTGYPTIKSYIEAEAQDGYELLYMDSSFIVTGIPVSPVLSSGEKVVTTSAFGEQMAVEPTAVIQLDGIYGFNSYDFEQYTDSTGSVTVGTVMSVATGAGSGGYGVLRSRRAVRYRPGQGAMARFTAMFSTPAAGYTQRAGFLAQEQALMVGYNGTSFGILRQNGGKAHIHSLTITHQANGSETVTITLNGVAFPIVTTGSTITANAIQIGSSSFTGWIVAQVGATIYFLSNTVGPKSGSFIVATSGGGTFTGTMATLQSGINHTENWVSQDDWNIDPLDGSGDSGILINPQKLNVFQIDFRWLGVGEIRFAIENPNTGNLIFFHHIHYSNANTSVHIDNPSLKIGYVAADINGGGTANVSTSGASIMGAIQGSINPTRFPTAASGSRITNMNTGSIYHILSVKNRLISANKINTREIILKKLAIGASAASSAACFVYIYLEPTYSTQPYFESVTDFSSRSVTEATLTGTPIAVFTTTTGAPNTIDLSDLRIVLPPNTRLAIGISSTSTLQRADASLTYIED